MMLSNVLININVCKRNHKTLIQIPSGVHERKIKLGQAGLGRLLVKLRGVECIILCLSNHHQSNQSRDLNSLKSIFQSPKQYRIQGQRDLPLQDRVPAKLPLATLRRSKSMTLREASKPLEPQPPRMMSIGGRRKERRHSSDRVPVSRKIGSASGLWARAATAWRVCGSFEEMMAMWSK